MNQWIKDIYMKHLKYNYPINHLQMFRIAALNKADDIYIHGNPKPSKYYTIKHGIREYILNAEVD